MKGSIRQKRKEKKRKNISLVKKAIFIYFAFFKFIYILYKVLYETE